VRGSRRSFATRPRRSAPDASRSRLAPIRKNGGAVSQPVGVARTLANPQLLRLVGSLARALTLWESCLFSTHPPGGAPTVAPDRSRAEPKRTFRPQPARRLAEACPIRRTAQGRGRINRKASLREMKPGPPSRPLAARGCPRDRRPAPDDWRPLREAIARGLRPLPRRPSLSRSPLGCTEVQPREPGSSTIRRFRVPSLM